MSYNSEKLKAKTSSLESQSEIIIENEAMVLVHCSFKDYKKIEELANIFQTIRNPEKSENIRFKWKETIEKINKCTLTAWKLLHKF